VRIVVAEDSAVLRDGLVRLLTARGHAVVAEVADASHLLSTVDEHRPDAVVVDVRMPPTHTDDGLRAAIEVRTRHPAIGLLVFSQYVEVRSAARLLADAPTALGYLLKDRVAQVSEFVDALERVAAGATVLDPEVVAALVRRRDRTDGLTPREREVLELMAEGRSNAGIAKAMVVTTGAVEKWVTSIFGKLGLPAAPDDHRRVLAVLHYLNSG
jgi:DNA-binding NarL/FixJ family response regulator